MDEKLSVKQITTGKDVRTNLKNEQTKHREEERDRILFRKRLKPVTEIAPELAEETELTAGYVQDLTTKLLKYCSETKLQIQKLRRALFTRPDLVDAFFEVENSVRSLVSHLTSKDSELHLDAAWCISNISASDHNRILTVVKLAGPYLISYLGSGNGQLQEHCALAIGNMASSGKKPREMLQSQGVIKPLIKLLQLSDPEVLQAAAFALSNMCQDLQPIATELTMFGLADHLIRILKSKSLDLEVVKEVSWLLSIITYYNDICHSLMNGGILSILVFWFSKTVSLGISKFALFTPIIRTLGNISSGEEDWCIQLAKEETFLSTLVTCCHFSQPHIKKELLWLLSNLLTVDSVIEEFSKENIDLIVMLYNQLSWITSISAKKQAIICLSNLLLSKRQLQSEVSESDVFRRVLEVMTLSDDELKYGCLEYVELFVKCHKEGVKTLRTLDGLSVLEAMQYHTEERIRNLASQLLQYVLAIRE